MAGRQAHVQLVICRHTQTDDNLEGRYTSQKDVSLNATGIEQAIRLAQKIAATFSVNQIVASDLTRARMVAHEICVACDSPVIFSDHLRETHMGEMIGCVKADEQRLFPASRHRCDHTHYDFRDIGGESADDVLFRSLYEIDHWAFLVKPLSAGKIPTIVIVGHGIALRTVFVDRLHLFRKVPAQGDFQVCNWLIGQL